MAPTIVSSQEAVIVQAQVIDQVAVLELAAESLAIGQAELQVLVIVPAEAPVLAIGQAEALVLVIVQVAAERELARAVAELEHGPVAAEREPDQVAVPLRIKSVIAVHHRGRVRLLAAVEDLAAGVETTRDPAATEAGIAWAAAG
jgi:hypothetical protein